MFWQFESRESCIERERRKFNCAVTNHHTVRKHGNLWFWLLSNEFIIIIMLRENTMLDECALDNQSADNQIGLPRLFCTICTHVCPLHWSPDHSLSFAESIIISLPKMMHGKCRNLIDWFTPPPFNKWWIVAHCTVAVIFFSFYHQYFANNSYNLGQLAQIQLPVTWYKWCSKKIILT